MDWTALHFAAWKGKVSVIKLFLARRISPEWTTAKSKAALHLAACKSHVEVAQALIDHGANLEQKTYRGETPLQLATKYTNPQIVELLLSRGASRFGVTNEGKTARELVQKSVCVSWRRLAHPDTRPTKQPRSCTLRLHKRQLPSLTLTRGSTAPMNYPEESRRHGFSLTEVLSRPQDLGRILHSY
jgi:ankyrin repeat protein